MHNDELPGHKTVGIVWNLQTDEFMVKVKPFSHPLTCRERFASLAMSILDSLEIVAPFLLLLKLLIQRLTKMGLAWDAEIPEPDKTVCNKLINSFLNLNNIVIPRCFVLTQNVKVIKGVKLHFFADASVDGIDVVCYKISLKIIYLPLTHCFSPKIIAISKKKGLHFDSISNFTDFLPKS